jgi:hypothetical protein
MVSDVVGKFAANNKMGQSPPLDDDGNNVMGNESAVAVSINTTLLYKVMTARWSAVGDFKTNWTASRRTLELRRYDSTTSGIDLSYSLCPTLPAQLFLSYQPDEDSC